jgi:hypothetical protein
MLLKTEVSPQKEKGENNARANAIYLFLVFISKKRENQMTIRCFLSCYINRVTSASAAMLRNVAAPIMLSISGIRSSFLTPNISIVGVHA